MLSFAVRPVGAGIILDQIVRYQASADMFPFDQIVAQQCIVGEAAIQHRVKGAQIVNALSGESSLTE